MRQKIFLDNHSTTGIDPEVLEEVTHVMRYIYGNPASIHHAFGQEAKNLVDESRWAVGSLLGCEPEEIVFTSGATEANNLAILGFMRLHKPKTSHLIVSLGEHPSVLETARNLESRGYQVTYLGIGGEGVVSIDELNESIRPQTKLVSIMLANNEIGTINPVQEIGKICRQHGIAFHSDAVQALAYERIDVKSMFIDMCSISAHKIHGPKGVGALYITRGKPKIRLMPMTYGGAQEFGIRSGTLNVPGIVGFSKACSIIKKDINTYTPCVRSLRDAFLRRIEAIVPESRINGSMELRLPNNANISFSGVDADALMLAIDHIACGKGSACTANEIKPSHVLAALGYDIDRINSSLRFGFSKFNTMEEVECAASAISEAVLHLRSLVA